MSKTTSKLVDELKRDLHGEQVGRPHALVCDYCDAEIDITEPVMYESLRIVDMPKLEQLLELSDEWVLDAARCRDCEIESLKPATDGYDEALILLSINESSGVLSADSSELTVVDVSPDGEGYYPPRIPANVVAEVGDPGYARWLRTEAVVDDLESGEYPPDVAELIRKEVKKSKEVPPSVDL